MRALMSDFDDPELVDLWDRAYFDQVRSPEWSDVTEYAFRVAIAQRRAALDAMSARDQEMGMQ